MGGRGLGSLAITRGINTGGVLGARAKRKLLVIAWRWPGREAPVHQRGQGPGASLTHER